MKRLGLIGCGALLMLMACSDDDAMPDSGGPGVCILENCPRPDAGVACCTANARCGNDPTGSGLQCLRNAGDALSSNVCVLAECPVPLVGSACCTPFGSCGLDPLSTGLICFANPPDINFDAGVPDASVCDTAECPLPEVGFVCCLANGECGVDPYGFGVCEPPPEPVDGAVPDPTTPPDDPSVTGECPSYLGVAGPVWGCCSDFGVCGTFAYDQCLLPLGTLLPANVYDEDAGTDPPLCTPPDDDSE